MAKEIDMLDDLFARQDYYLLNNPDLSVKEIKSCCTNIERTWNIAVISASSDIALKRYFKLHLQNILRLLDQPVKITENPNPTELVYLLLELFDHLLDTYSNYLDYEVKAPNVYLTRHMKRVEHLTSQLFTHLELTKLDISLKNCIFSYLREFSEVKYPDTFTLSALNYHRLFVNTTLLAFDTNDIQKELFQTLFEINFNYLPFFSCVRENVMQTCSELVSGQNKANFLLEKKRDLGSISLRLNTIFDPSWPSIKEMSLNWLGEEIMMIEKLIIFSGEKNKNEVSKLLLNISVANLAFLLKLFHSQRLFGDASIKEILNFFSTNYATKRQSKVSFGSLSKEYYSTTQVTAAFSRDLLLKMVAKINHDFFPVLVAVTAIIGFR